jgi:hypothetical protein
MAIGLNPSYEYIPNRCPNYNALDISGIFDFSDYFLISFIIWIIILIKIHNKIVSQENTYNLNK